ncbi:MAG: hypothetical protein HQ522_06495 [Bacteroidetes bacterium]|nr:hypothetical protein [Bacteroidota bacterium]
MTKEKKTIAYVTTPVNFASWTIYNLANKKPDGSLKSTSYISGYGIEQLLPHLNGTETVLKTGNVDLNFIMNFNNSDVYGISPFDFNLNNEDYIGKYLQMGAVKITNPKTRKNMIHGLAYFEDGPKWKAISNVNLRWNGWAMPFIHKSDIQNMCDAISDPQYTKYEMINDNVVITCKNNPDEPIPVIIEPSFLDGEIYYYMGDEGLIWQFNQ